MIDYYRYVQKLECDVYVTGKKEITKDGKVIAKYFPKKKRRTVKSRLSYIKRIREVWNFDKIFRK